MTINKNNNMPFLVADIKIIYALSKTCFQFRIERENIFYKNYGMSPWLKIGSDLVPVINFVDIVEIIKRIMGI